VVQTAEIVDVLLIDAASDERELARRGLHPQVDEPLESEQELDADELRQFREVDRSAVGDDQQPAALE